MLTIAPSMTSKSSSLGRDDFVGLLRHFDLPRVRGASAPRRPRSCGSGLWRLSSGKCLAASCHQWRSHRPTLRSVQRARRRSSTGISRPRASRKCRRGDHARAAVTKWPDADARASWYRAPLRADKAPCRPDADRANPSNDLEKQPLR